MKVKCANCSWEGNAADREKDRNVLCPKCRSPLFVRSEKALIPKEGIVTPNIEHPMQQIVDQYEPPTRFANGCGCVFLAPAVIVSSVIACLTTCGTITVTGEALGFRMSTGYPIASPSLATIWASIFVGLIFGFFLFFYLVGSFKSKK